MQRNPEIIFYKEKLFKTLLKSDISLSFENFNNYYIFAVINKRITFYFFQLLQY